MSNRIHPTAIVGPGVELGSNNVVMPHAVIVGRTVIGNDNWIGPHAAIGTPAQHLDADHGDWQATGSTGVEIGSGNRIREFTTIHQGTTRVTRVGNDCYLMAYSHVPHDAEYEDGVTLANSAQVGGHTWIGAGATIGLGVSIKQRLSIGSLAMVGMNSTVTSNIPPFSMAVGTPAKVVGANRVGLQRHGLASVETVDEIHRAYREDPTTLSDVVRGLEGLESLMTEFKARTQ